MYTALFTLTSTLPVNENVIQSKESFLLTPPISNV